MPTIRQDRGTPFAPITAIGTTIAQATLGVSSGKIIYVTDISGSSDNARGTISVYSGSTILWQDSFGSDSYHHQFVQPILCTATLTVQSTGTLYCSANVTGFYVNTS